MDKELEIIKEERILEVSQMIKWCGYEYSVSDKEDNLIFIYYQGLKPDGTNKISGNPVRFLSFDNNYVYLHSWIFGAHPHKIYMKELLKFYLDNPNYF